MGKPTKAETANRLRDVAKLMVAGAEFAEIRQFASERQWGVTDRSIRRYMEKAYKRMAEASKRDSKQLLGRHLMQRRALYARCLKQGDHRTALNVLKDEANLQGVYPPTKIDHSSGNGQESRPVPVLPRKVRLARTLAAEQKKDRTELQLLEQANEIRHYRFTDLHLPKLLLNTMTMEHVIEQLEHATAVLLCLWNTAAFGDEDGDWDFLGMTSAFHFRIGVEGWRLFCESLGVDADYLLQGNYGGQMLEECSENICRISPSADELKAYLVERGIPEPHLPTPDGIFKAWRRMIADMLDN